MPEKKPNRRVQFTRGALRNALIELAIEKPLREITVTDVCTQADINRSTFYLHYPGVHALLCEVEDQLLDQFRADLKGLSPDPRDLAAVLSRLKADTRRRMLMHALLDDPYVALRIHKMTYAAFRLNWQRDMLPDEENKKRLIFTFIVNGAVALLSEWIADDMPELSAEQTVLLLYDLIRRGPGRLRDGYRAEQPLSPPP